MTCPKTGAAKCECRAQQIKKSVLIAVIINIVLPYLLKPFATKKEIKPPNGAHNLSFKEQLMHMFVHHAQVPLTSSVIVAVIVSLSVYFSYEFEY
tara:strand:- start:37 stop:321 length:285 start_codon:yes stop_codon:yes gene_type:complete